MSHAPVLVVVGGEVERANVTEAVTFQMAPFDEHGRVSGVPVFVKQDSGRLPGQQGRIPDDMWIQEFPT